MIMKIQHIKICGVQLKLCLERNLQHYNAHIRIEERSKIDNLRNEGEKTKCEQREGKYISEQKPIKLKTEQH